MPTGCRWRRALPICVLTNCLSASPAARSWSRYAVVRSRRVKVAWAEVPPAAAAATWAAAVLLSTTALFQGIVDRRAKSRSAFSRASHVANLAEASDGMVGGSNENRVSEWLMRRCQLAVGCALPCLEERPPDNPSR